MAAAGSEGFLRPGLRTPLQSLPAMLCPLRLFLVSDLFAGSMLKEPQIEASRTAEHLGKQNLCESGPC